MKKRQHNFPWKKVAMSILVISIGIMAYTSVINKMIDRTAINKIDKKSRHYLDDAFKRAIYTYAIARGINGVISVIQNTHIAVSPAGIGVNVAVGEILDPVNDLIERFSWVMLVSTTSLGMQKIFMKIGAWLGLNILLTTAMLFILVGMWVPDNFTINFTSWGYKLIIVAIMIRFCIPAVSIASDRLYDLFLREKYDQATKSLNQLNEAIKKTDVINEKKKPKREDKSVLGSLKKYYKETKETVKINERIQDLKRKMTDYAKYTINLIVVFMLQTVIIPVLFLWIFVKLIGFIAVNELRFTKEEAQMEEA